MKRNAFGTESRRLDGDALVPSVRELTKEGNVRRIIVRDEEGRTLIEAPLRVGVARPVLPPVWAALEAIAGLVAECTIDIERDALWEAERSSEEHIPLDGEEEDRPHG